MTGCRFVCPYLFRVRSSDAADRQRKLLRRHAVIGLMVGYYQLLLLL